MSDHVTIVIGGSAEDMGARFISAWHRAASGEIARPERVVTFEDFETLARALTPARFGVLRHLAETGPATSIKAIAEHIGRPYRRVHDDVAALVSVGLVRRDGRRITLEAGSIEVQIRLAGRGIGGQRAIPPSPNVRPDAVADPADRTRQAYSLSDLLAGITKDNLHVAHDFELSD